jgi:hypothetical protein
MSRRLPITGWQRCVHKSAAFDTFEEYLTAGILDQTEGINWWLRNDPASLRIPTPAGNFEPDFVYLRKEGSNEVFGIVEVKGGIFWNGPGSLARIKASAAAAWVQVVNSAAGAVAWEFAVILDQDVQGKATLGQLRQVALEKAP